MISRLTTQPLVTISFPVYEGDDYMADSINSVLKQDYENLEIIIIDDCGKTNAMQIVRDCIERFPKKRNIRILRQPHNMEQGPARNRSIDEAKGDYIFFMDADDILSENAISLLVKEILAEEVDFVEGGRRNDSGVFLAQNRCTERQIIKGECLFDSIWHNRLSCDFYVTNKLFSISFLRKNNIKCLTPHFDDFHFAMLSFMKSHSCVVIPDITYINTSRPEQITRTYKRNITLATAQIVRTFVTEEYKLLDHWNNSVTRERAILRDIKLGMPFCYKAFRSKQVCNRFALSMLHDILCYPKLRKVDHSLFSNYEKSKHRYYKAIQSMPYTLRFLAAIAVNFSSYWLKERKAAV